jgi:hypothetical protein
LHIVAGTSFDARHIWLHTAASARGDGHHITGAEAAKGVFVPGKTNPGIKRRIKDCVAYERQRPLAVLVPHTILGIQGESSRRVISPGADKECPAVRVCSKAGDVRVLERSLLELLPRPIKGAVFWWGRIKKLGGSIVQGE